MAADGKKRVSYEEAPGFFEQLRGKNLTIVQCHGTFDLIHPGHITHFEEAKELGDVLVVTITGEAWVNKGPGRPYFNDQLRVKSLTALECIDYVVVIPFAAAVEAIECVKPAIYCKGKEYADPENDVTGNIRDDVTTVEKHGGKIEYVGSVVFSSSRLLNNHFETLPEHVKAYCKDLHSRHSTSEFKEAVESFSNLRVLVVGDIIFDRYSFVHVQGLTSKNRIMSSRFLGEETHAGGSLAVLRHIQSFTENVDFFSLSGSEPWVLAELGKYVPKTRNHSIISDDFTTVIKQRYVEKSKRTQEISKLFALNYIDASSPTKETEEAICKKLSDIVNNYDLILVADFGHGLMQKKVRELVQEKARFLALNCQTNSNNHGFNIIDRQYQKADCFSLDDQEILLSCGQRNPDYVGTLMDLKTRFGAQFAWLTRGANETIGINGRGKVIHAPVFAQQVTDTVGAGDALFSLVALSACMKLPIELATFIGQLAGAQAVNIVGNAEGVRKDKLLKSGITTLSF